MATHTSLQSAALLAALLTPCLTAQRPDLVERDPEAAPTRRALEASGEQVQIFDQHVTTLSSPFMEGRVPGSRGMEVAREYFEYYLREAGTRPPWGEGQAASYRQRFPLRGSREVATEHVAVADGSVSFVAGQDYNTLGLGGTGTVTAPVVFVGYAINEGSDGYTSFPANEDLSGKIALLLRHEPLNPDGKSRWSMPPRPWTREASLSRKVRAVVRRGAVGVIVANTPGASDPRAEQLTRSGGGGRTRGELPVMHFTSAAADRLISALAPDADSLAALRARCDEAGLVVDFPGQVTLTTELVEQENFGENVAGMIPGRGALADEWIVVGAHLDHLGIGLYGARDSQRIGQLHPGADDNASGSAGVLMLAERMMRHYAELPEGESARSLLFVGWDAEEAGLHGSRYYVENPLAPIEKHALCINFDMIGRIVNKRLSVSGTKSAAGMEEWLLPMFEESPLDVVVAGGMGPGGSDHFAFNSKRVPWLFAIIQDFHNDYHTPDDVAWKINRVDAVHTIDLFEKITQQAATQTAPFEYQPTGRGRRG